MTREEVTRFAREMERVLKENDWKDPYTDFEEEWLLDSLEGEMNELNLAIKEGYGDVQKECLDVANYAMFIFEVNRRRKEEESNER